MIYLRSEYINKIVLRHFINKSLLVIYYFVAHHFTVMVDLLVVVVPTHSVWCMYTYTLYSTRGECVCVCVHVDTCYRVRANPNAPAIVPTGPSHIQHCNFTRGI